MAVVAPDAASVAAFGRNLLDPRTPGTVGPGRLRAGGRGAAGRGSGLGSNAPARTGGASFCRSQLA